MILRSLADCVGSGLAAPAKPYQQQPARCQQTASDRYCSIAKVQADDDATQRRAHRVAEVERADVDRASKARASAAAIITRICSGGTTAKVNTPHTSNARAAPRCLPSTSGIDVVTLSADVSGRIVSLTVQDNQHVEKGQLLLEIDPARYALAVEHARRSVAVAKAAQGQSQAAIISSEALLKQRQSEKHRRRTLKQGFAISGEEWEKSSTEVAVAQAELMRNQANLGLAQANVQLAVAALTQAELDLQRTRVTAPVSGYVTNLLTREGDYASAGSALLALVDSDSFYVSGYFEETKLPRINEGNKVRIQLMSGETFAGAVQSIAFAITDRENSPAIACWLISTPATPGSNWRSGFRCEFR